MEVAINFECLSDYKEQVVVVAEPTVRRKSGENCRDERINIYIHIPLLVSPRFVLKRYGRVPR